MAKNEVKFYHSIETVQNYKNKKKLKTKVLNSSALAFCVVTPAGFKPATLRAEI